MIRPAGLQQHAPTTVTASPHHHHHHHIMSSPPPPTTVVAGYRLTEKLGSGSFAVVYKGEWVTTTTAVVPTPNKSPPPPIAAVKAISLTSDRLTKKVLANLQIEIAILQKLSHPNIVALLTDPVQSRDPHTNDPLYFYLVLEYCAGGDVQHLIRSRDRRRLSERLVRRLLRDLARGLGFLWHQELIHRDIKPQNLLLTTLLPREESVDNPPHMTNTNTTTNDIDIDDDDPPPLFVLKIADFGFARHLQSTSLAETLCGSPLYMAPEILQHQRYAQVCIYSII
jgi:serine/threonine-protein kinase ULK2